VVEKDGLEEEMEKVKLSGCARKKGKLIKIEMQK